MKQVIPPESDEGNEGLLPSVSSSNERKAKGISSPRVPLSGEVEMKETAPPPATSSGEVETEGIPSPPAPISGEVDVIKVATETLDKLLKLIGIEGEVKVVSRELPVVLNIAGKDLAILIGRQGQTLASLEYITKLVVAGRLKSWLPLYVDAAGYKMHRSESLQRLALHLVEQVKTRKHAISLEPMPPDERRIIHLTLADHPDVTTHSIGDGDTRRVVISPKQS